MTTTTRSSSRLEDIVIDAATAAATALELEAEVVELKGLVALADEIRSSATDTKWVELRKLLRTGGFGRDAAANGSDGRPDAPRTPEDAPTPTGPRKLIVFSEHKDTLNYVADRIRAELGRPEAVITIHGGVKRHDRRELQERFRVDPTVQVLVATDAAGEGVNLQVANMMVNYDLPWNPNRIEQRFGRIHRIGQQRPCHLWNLVAHETREGQVFTRLFEKIEQQRVVYGDQVYDVLGDSHINTSLQELLLNAIRADADPAHLAFMEEVIEGEIGQQLVSVLEERALVAGLADPAANEKIRDLMERSRARKLQPWFVEAFFSAALKSYGGRIAGRESGRFEITRVPAAVRSQADTRLGPVHDRYARVAFDKDHVRLDGADRAELISPGTPLLAAVVNKVLADHGHTLDRGATLVDSDDHTTEARLLVYLDHTITDGRHVGGRRQVVSRRFQYVEIDRHGNIRDPGGEPYIGYEPLAGEQRTLLDTGANLALDWVDHSAESMARDWAIEHLAGPHLEEIDTITKARVDKVRQAVRERLEAEIRYWDERTEQIKAQELAGGKPRINSGRARARADELETRLARRRLELDMEADSPQQPAQHRRRCSHHSPGTARPTRRHPARPQRDGRQDGNRPPSRRRRPRRRAGSRPHPRGTGPQQPRFRRPVGRSGHRHPLLHRGQGPPTPHHRDQRQRPTGPEGPLQPRPLAPSGRLGSRRPSRRSGRSLPHRPVPRLHAPLRREQDLPQRRQSSRGCWLSALSEFQRPAGAECPGCRTLRRDAHAGHGPAPICTPWP